MPSATPSARKRVRKPPGAAKAAAALDAEANLRSHSFTKRSKFDGSGSAQARAPLGVAGVPLEYPGTELARKTLL